MHIFEKSKSVQNKIVLGAIKRKKMLLDREINEAKLIVQFFNLTGPEKYWKSSMKKGLSWKCCFWKMFDVSFVNKNGHFNNKSPSIFFSTEGPFNVDKIGVGQKMAKFCPRKASQILVGDLNQLT